MKSDEAIPAFQAYSNYLHAFEISQDKIDLPSLQSELGRFKRLKGIPKTEREKVVDKLKPHLFRGALSMDAMRRIPVDDTPALAFTANLWVPVQAYYALHGYGLATLIALGSKVPNDHRAFCAASAESIVKYLIPKPLGICCTGLSTQAECDFHGWNGNIEAIKELSPLTKPENTKPDIFIAKAIYTTRNHKLKQIFSKKRTEGVKKGKSYRTVSYKEKQSIAKNLAPTSVFDFFYRLRERSNYDDPDLFLYGQLQEDLAKRYFLSIVNVSDGITKLLLEIIKRKIGNEEHLKILHEFNKATHRTCRK